MLSPPARTTSVAGTVPESTSAIEWMAAVCSASPLRRRASSSWRSKVTAATATLGCMSVPRGIVDGGRFGGFGRFRRFQRSRAFQAVRRRTAPRPGPGRPGHFPGAVKAQWLPGAPPARTGRGVNDGGGQGIGPLDGTEAAFEVDLNGLRQLDRASEAVCAASWPVRLAEETANGPVRVRSSRAIWSAGILRATVPLVSPRSQSNDGCACRISVSPPGQKASASSRASADISVASPSRALTRGISTGGGICRLRPLEANTW